MTPPQQAKRRARQMVRRTTQDSCRYHYNHLPVHTSIPENTKYKSKAWSSPNIDKAPPHQISLLLIPTSYMLLHPCQGYATNSFSYNSHMLLLRESLFEQPNAHISRGVCCQASCVVAWLVDLLLLLSVSKLLLPSIDERPLAFNLMVSCNATC